MSSPRGAVLITGGIKRLGLAFAAQCLDMGFDLVLHFRSNKEPAERMIARNPRLRRRISFLQADLNDLTRDLVAEALELRGMLCGLINNASAFETGSIHNEAHLRSLIEINALAPLRLGNSFYAHARQGWIVNITDAHICGSSLRFQNYRLSKRLLADLTRQMALAYAPHIRVNAIAPGAMLPSPTESATRFRVLRRHIPLRKVGDIASLRQALAYLITNSYVTGQALCVDGGWSMKN